MKTIIANDGKTYYLPKSPVWRTGFPDKPGWYPASIFRIVTSLRYFDGACFSESCAPVYTSKQASEFKKQHPVYQSSIRWTDPWWTPSAQEAIKKGEL